MDVQELLGRLFDGLIAPPLQQAALHLCRSIDKYKCEKRFQRDLTLMGKRSSHMQFEKTKKQEIVNLQWLEEERTQRRQDQNLGDNE